MSADSITLSRMRFHSCHGALPEEKTRPQPWEVTVTLELPLAGAGRADDLEKTIDYRRIHEVARAVMEGAPVNLVETLACRIAEDLLRAFAQVRAVSVEVTKLKPPVNFDFNGLKVRVRRERK
ncbi:dihydroneopterin aldolase [Ereboglobus sp. PH5-10]|uniref:dihydroneopterin aldolase n=1 Tax=Ereboglobus sp. PH5-10 TaxID=2940629 RepID=UPI00240673E9|nr:dihydroneopterin aldolase [Ereboglobus sp. PH5-10]MDF9826286.1 dihydroneopterin aldolase [Ereboglobus sp. PH5-10]